MANPCPHAFTPEERAVADADRELKLEEALLAAVKAAALLAWQLDFNADHFGKMAETAIMEIVANG